MVFKLRFKDKLKTMMIFILIIIAIMIVDYKILIHPFTIFFYIVISVNAIRNRSYYSINDNKISFYRGKKSITIDINDIQEMQIINNFTVARRRHGGISVTKCLVVNEEKISINAWLKNEEYLDIIKYLKERYDIKM